MLIFKILATRDTFNLKAAKLTLQIKKPRTTIAIAFFMLHDTSKLMQSQSCKIVGFKRFTSSISFQKSSPQAPQVPLVPHHTQS